MSYIKPPRVSDLVEIAEKLNLQPTDEELKAYEALVPNMVESYRVVQSMPEPVERVKYKRDMGYRPDPEENPLNAWYWKVTIDGSEQNPHGSLVGKTLAVKDSIFLAGIPMMDGSKILEGFIPEYDATVVTRLLDAGVKIIGKTNVPDMCLSGSSFPNQYGAVRNPWDQKRSAGGSSSGSGAAVANHDVDLALGGDQGGSVRIPASCCGIVGLKPTHGLVPYTGAVPIDASMDHLGPMTRSVKDCAEMLQVVAGYDNGQDHRQPDYKFPIPDYVKGLTESTPLKIGILKEGFDACADEVKKVVEKAVETMKASGKFAKIEELSIPLHTDGHHIWTPIGVNGVYNQMFYGYGYGCGHGGLQSSRLSEALFKGMKSYSHTLSDTCKMMLIMGKYVQDKYGLGTSALACNLILKLRELYDEGLEKFDLLLMPTLPHSPCEIPDEKVPLSESVERQLSTIANTSPFNLTHHPAITINAGHSEVNGMPVGLQLVGKRWADDTVLKGAYQVEQLLTPFQKTLKKVEA